MILCRSYTVTVQYKTSAYTANFQDSDGEASICHAMASLEVSSANKTQLSTRHPPGYPFRLPSPPTTPSKRKKYYVVAVGKCTGVFDNWFVDCFTSRSPSLPRFTEFLDRPYVQSLTSGVSGNCHVSYISYSEAFASYMDLKARGLVKIVRMRGDERRFGPLKEAMQ